MLFFFAFSSLSWAENAPLNEVPFPSTFKLSIYSFPKDLDPQHQNSSVSYLFQNLFRNLLIYKDKKLIPDLAESCTKKNKRLTCRLKKNLKWNTGEPLLASDFVETYKRILDPKNKALRPDFLFSVTNAREIYQGLKKPNELKVRAINPREIEFQFNEADDEFEYNLATFFLAPTKGSYELNEGATFLSTGPYQISSWVTGQKLILKSNPNYPKSRGKNRPDVEFLLIQDDSVNLRLYEKDEIHMVRRLPTLLLNKYQGRSDFFEIPALRFDYLGFGQELKDDVNTRRSLALSLDYPAWQKILFSIGRPGCPGFPPDWMTPARPCFEQTKELSVDAKKYSWVFTYSLLGGDDHRRTAEWLQDQWKKNLKIDFRVKGFENKTYVAELEKNPPLVFRKGLAPDRATCAGILENFTSSHPENYLQWRDPSFDKIVASMRGTSDLAKKRNLCSQALDRLMGTYQLIPTGAYNFALLVKPQFTGWNLNELNQLDLSELQVKGLK